MRSVTYVWKVTGPKIAHYLIQRWRATLETIFSCCTGNIKERWRATNSFCHLSQARTGFKAVPLCLSLHLPFRTLGLAALFAAAPLLTAIISHSGRQLLGNKLSFTLCSIHILFISNKFHKFWMSFDFRRTHAKKGQKWAKSQADWPILGRPAWHLHTHQATTLI